MHRPAYILEDSEQIMGAEEKEMNVRDGLDERQQEISFDPTLHVFT